MSMFNTISCGQSASNLKIGEYTVESLTECALICLMNQACAQLTADTNALKAGKSGRCILYEAEQPLNQYKYDPAPDLCTMSRDQIKLGGNQLVDSTTDSVGSLSTVVASSYNNSYIIGAVETVQSLCGLYSYYDIVVLTLDGVYIYDDVTHLYTSPGPCKPVQTFHSVFTAYTGLPDITDVRAIHSYNGDRVEIYSDTQVWSFMFAGTSQFPEHGYPMSITQHLNSKTTHTIQIPFPSNPLWSTLRARYGTQERYYYDGSNIVYFANFLPYYATLSPKTKEYNVNGQNINPWISLPDNVADVMLKPGQFDDFIVFTLDLKVYAYVMDYTVNINDPDVRLEYRGELLL